MDELGEFGRAALEGLREPLEESVIRVARAAIRVTMPARFLLVAATNPCPCGGGPPGACECDDGARLRYLRRLSGPITDRFDLRVVVHAPPSTSFSASTPATRRATCQRVVAPSSCPVPCGQAQCRPGPRRARHAGAVEPACPRPAPRGGRDRSPHRSWLSPGQESPRNDRRPRRSARRADLDRRHRVGAADAGAAASAQHPSDGRPVDRMTATPDRSPSAGRQAVLSAPRRSRVAARVERRSASAAFRLSRTISGRPRRRLRARLAVRLLRRRRAGCWRAGNARAIAARPELSQGAGSREASTPASPCRSGLLRLHRFATHSSHVKDQDRPRKSITP